MGGNSVHFLTGCMLAVISPPDLHLNCFFFLATKHSNIKITIRHSFNHTCSFHCCVLKKVFHLPFSQWKKSSLYAECVCNLCEHTSAHGYRSTDMAPCDPPEPMKEAFAWSTQHLRLLAQQIRAPLSATPCQHLLLLCFHLCLCKRKCALPARGGSWINSAFIPDAQPITTDRRRVESWLAGGLVSKGKGQRKRLNKWQTAVFVADKTGKSRAAWTCKGFIKACLVEWGIQ